MGESSRAASIIGRHIVLIIGGGIGAYKILELIRLLRDRGVSVIPVLTAAAEHFVTPLSVAALAGCAPRQDLFDPSEEEGAMDHIGLSRRADLIVVAPATADLIGRMAAGLGDDLATTLLLATDKPVLIAPAMNVRMWQHAAVVDNVALLERRGIIVVPPESGSMACGEYGPGRLVEPADLADLICAHIGKAIGVVSARPLAGVKILVTAGATREPLDPVRYISNHSSGKQGYAIAAALRALGAEIVLISGAATAPPPADIVCEEAMTARDMLAACEAALPVDIAICVAAVSDWRPATAATRKLAKTDLTAQKLGAEDADSEPVLRLDLIANPDILHHLGHHAERPGLVVGFAAQTHDMLAYGHAKRARKGADWILCNNVAADQGVMGGDSNEVVLIHADGVENWPRASKRAVADRLAGCIVDWLARQRES